VIDNDIKVVVIDNDIKVVVIDNDIKVVVIDNDIKVVVIDNDIKVVVIYNNIEKGKRSAPIWSRDIYYKFHSRASFLGFRSVRREVFF